MKMEEEHKQPPPRSTPNILVTGTPGTGKTTFCQLLNQSLSFIYVNVGSVIKDNRLYKNWNEEFDVPQFEDEMVIEFMQKNYPINTGGVLIDFHTPDIFPNQWIDLVVVLRCNNTDLYKRLEERGYPQPKITQNIQCQIFGQISNDTAEWWEGRDSQAIIEMQNQKQADMEANLAKVIQYLVQWKARRQV